MVPAVRTQTDSDYQYDDNEEGFIPIFVIKRTEGSPLFGSGFPFGQGSPFGQGFPFNIFDESESKVFNEENIPEIPLVPSIFDNEEPGQDGEGQVPLCGFICSILKEFDDKLRAIEGQVKNIPSNSGNGDEPEIHNNTYTEKVSKKFLIQIQPK